VLCGCVALQFLVIDDPSFKSVHKQHSSGFFWRPFYTIFSGLWRSLRPRRTDHYVLTYRHGLKPFLLGFAPQKRPSLKAIKARLS
jgi:hypothetical protein